MSEPITTSSSCPECGGTGARGCGAGWHDGKPDAPSPLDEPTAPPTRLTREQVWALDRLVRAAVESARDPHGMTLTVDETTDAVVDQLIEEAPAFVALLAGEGTAQPDPSEETTDHG